MWATRHLDPVPGDLFTLSSDLASIGLALPAAFGAPPAYSDRGLDAFAGDSGFSMVIGDLITAVSVELPISVVVCDNSKAWSDPDEAGGRRPIRVRYGIGELDFAEPARAVGANRWRVENPTTSCRDWQHR